MCTKQIIFNRKQLTKEVIIFELDQLNNQIKVNKVNL